MNILDTTRLGCPKIAFRWLIHPILVTFFVCSLTSRVCGAQSAAFEEIIVTAQKREQSIYEVPVSVSAFSQDTIEKAGITNLIDIGKLVPNLSVTNFSAGHTSSANPFIRGIGLQDHLITTDPGVSVYLDGVYLGRQVGQNWSLANIERVEVLRGPQGTLYGRNSIGGAINIITRKPGDEEIYRASVETGSRGRVNTDFYSNFKLSDDVDMLLSGAFKRRDGIGKFLNLPDADVDVGELQDVSARVALKWNPIPKFSILLAADGNEGDGGLNPYTTLIDEVPSGSVYNRRDALRSTTGNPNLDVAANPFDQNTGQLNQTETSNYAYGVSATANYSFSEDLDAKLLVSKRRSDYKAGLDDDSLEDNFLSFPEVGFADQISAELQLTGQHGRFDFIAGVYYFEEEGSNHQPNYVFNGGPGSFLLGQEVTSYAVYGNVGYAVNEDWHVSGGLRYTEDEKIGSIDINNLINTSAKENFDDISWELATTYSFAGNLTAYGTIQNGYQSGQFPARPFCLFGSFTFPAGPLDPDNCFTATKNITALNYEVGIKGQPLNNLQMSIAVFLTDYSDLPYQVSTTTTGGFNTVNLVVDQISAGVEWESSLQVFEGFYINTSLGYINVDVDAPNAVAPLTPEFTASISPEYSRPIGTGTLIFRVDYSYRGDMFGEPSSDPGRFTKIDSRSLLNFNVNYLSSDESWTLGFYGRNVTDERYDSARLNTGDYVLRILSNDASEFGIRLVKKFQI